MMRTELQIKRAEYMRNWRAANREHINAQVSARRRSRKESGDPRYDRMIEQCKARGERYRSSDPERVNSLKRSNEAKHRTPEKGKAKREKYKFAYSTKVSIKSARKRAADYELPFDLDAQWFDDLFVRGCAVTGLPLDKNGSKTAFTVNIDRVVPELGYLKSNCRLVCACFNKAKWNWSDVEVEKMARALIAKIDSADA